MLDKRHMPEDCGQMTMAS